MILHLCFPEIIFLSSNNNNYTLWNLYEKISVYTKISFTITVYTNCTFKNVFTEDMLLYKITSNLMNKANFKIHDFFHKIVSLKSS